MAQSVSFNINLKVNGQDAVRTVSVNVGELRRAIDETKTSAERTTSALIGFNQSVNAIRNVSDTIQQMAGVLNTLTEESRSFGGAMAAANTMAGKGGEEFGRLKDQVTELSKTIPIARDQLANGLYQVISNGVPEDNWITYLEQSAKASVGGIANLEEVVKVTSTVIKNYGLSWDEAGAIQDKIQLTAKNGVTSFEQMAQALPRVTANAATLGVSVNELMATFATLTGVSGNTAEVSTQLAAVFTALVKPSSEAAEMARQMGVQFDAAAVKAAGGMQNFIQSLDRDVKRFAASSGMLEQEIYGKLFGSAESLRALIPLTGELADKFDENVAAMEGSSGTIEDAFDIMASTGAAKLQLLNNKLGEYSDILQATVGNTLPYINFASQVTMSTASALQLVVTLRSLSVGTKVASAAMAVFGPILQVCRAAMTGATVSAQTLKLAIRGLMICTGVGIAVAALTEAFNYFCNSADDATDKVDELKGAQDAYQSTVAETQVALDGETRRLRELIDAKKDTTSAVNDLNSKYGTVFGNHKTAAEWYDTLTKKSKIYAQQLGYEAQMKLLSTQLAEKRIQLQENNDKRRQLWKEGKAQETVTRTTVDVKSDEVHTSTSRRDSQEYTNLKQNGRELLQDIYRLNNQLNIATDKMKAAAAQLGAPSGQSATPKTAPATTATTTPRKTTPAKVTTPQKDTALAGSITWYTEAINNLKKKLEDSVTDPGVAQGINKQISGLEQQLNMLKIQLGIESIPPVEVDKEAETVIDRINRQIENMKPDPIVIDVKGANKLKDLETLKDLGNIDLSSFESVRNGLAGIKSMTDPTTQGMAAAGASCQALGQSLQQLGADSAAAKAGMIMAALGQIALSFATALNSASKNWITWLAFGIAGTAQMISMVSTISQFATGGIVGGNETSGDRVLVRVNSGEMILNAAQQARLFALADGTAQVQPNTASLMGATAGGSATGSRIVGKIRGRDIVLATANETRSHSRRSNIRI